MSSRHYVLWKGRRYGVRDGGPWTHALVAFLPGKARPLVFGHASLRTVQDREAFARRGLQFQARTPGARVHAAQLHRSMA